MYVYVCVCVLVAYGMRVMMRAEVMKGARLPSVKRLISKAWMRDGRTYTPSQTAHTTGA